MSSTTKSPGTIVDGGGEIAFSNPGNAASSNNVRATATAGALLEDEQAILRCTNFDFSEIPDSATLIGIGVLIEGSAPSSVLDCNLRVNGVNRLTFKPGTGVALPTTETVMSEIGGTGDMWDAGADEPPTLAEMKLSGSGVNVLVTLGSFESVSIDHVQMTLYWAQPAIRGWTAEERPTDWTAWKRR